VHGTGIVTKCDELNIHFTNRSCWDAVRWFAESNEEDARSKFRLPKVDVRDWHFVDAVKDVTDSGPNQKLILPIGYRPFDSRFTYYTGRSRGIMGWPVERVMRHVAQDATNVMLSTTRSVETGDFTHVFALQGLTTHHTVSIKEVNYAFPLWLVPAQVNPATPLHEQRRPNLSPDFLKALAQALGRKPVEPHGLPENVTPEQVLAYLYAVLHAPSYRSRYGAFLKSDFARIPLAAVAGQTAPVLAFPAIWQALLPLGETLMNLHLLKDVPAALRASYPQQGKNDVEKPRYEPPTTGANTSARGRVWINATQYFDGVPPETWTFKVGGYQVCEKWLKDRKGRVLEFDDIKHYCSVVAALTRTRELMLTIDTVANGRLWPA
jgi:predicted helicase